MLHPLPAPLGYLDKGKGRVKEIDPARAALVRRAFELYGTGKYSLDSLGDEMLRLGLRSQSGKRLSRNGLSILLNNPFYIGIIRLKRTNETFPGSHQPLITKALFDHVQQILAGKTKVSSWHHDFLFQRLLTCKRCDYTLSGEQQKGHNYYRCHTKRCPTKCIREEVVEEELLRRLSFLRLSEQERAYASEKLAGLTEGWEAQQKSVIQALILQVAQLGERLARLTDAYIDKLIDKTLFEERKTVLLLERRGLEDKITELNKNGRNVPNKIREFLELAGNAYSLYKSGFPAEKRELLKTVTSNRCVEAKSVEFSLDLPFNELASRFENTNGSPQRDRLRTFETILQNVWEWFQANPGSRIYPNARTEFSKE